MDSSFHESFHEIDTQLAAFAGAWMSALEGEQAGHVMGQAAEFSVEQLLRNPEAMAATYLINRFATAKARHSDARVADYLLRTTDLAGLPIGRSLVVIATAMTMIRLERDDARGAVREAESVLERVATAGDADRSAVCGALPWLWVASGLAHLTSGHIQKAVPLFQSAAANGAVGYPHFQGLCYLALISGTVAFSSEAIALADAAIALGEAHGWLFGNAAGAAWLGRAICAAGLLDLEKMDVSLAMVQAVTGLDANWRLLIHAVQNISLDLRSDYEQVERNLTEIAHRFEVEHAPEVFQFALAYSVVLHQIVSGNPGAALETIDRQEFGEPLTDELAAFRGCAYLSLGLPRRAIEDASRHLRSHGGEIRASISISLAVSAAADMFVGHVEEAMATFALIAERASHAGAYGLKLIPDSLLEALLAEARNRGLELPEIVARAGTLAFNRIDTVLSTIGTLTRSERELLMELRGRTTLDEIAERTFAAKNTVKTHLRSVYAKLGVASREEAIDLANTCGFFASAAPISDTAAKRRRARSAP